MNNSEFVEAILNIDKKVEFKYRTFIRERYDVVVFNGIFSCKVLNNENSVLNIEHFASNISPHDAIYAICVCFDELKEKYGVRKIKIVLNQIELTITDKNSKNPKEKFYQWLKHLA